MIGALLLLRPAAPRPSAAIVPVLIGIALVLVLLQPRMQAKAAARHADADDARRQPAHRMLLLRPGCSSPGVYGGYFGAAQGVLLMGLLGVAAARAAAAGERGEERARR